MSYKTVSVTLPEWVWGRLVTIAEYRNTTAGDLIADQVLVVLEKDTARGAQLVRAVRGSRAAAVVKPRNGRRP